MTPTPNLDIFAEHHDPARDRPLVRRVTAEGSDFLLEREGQSGFWHIRREHGQVPASLQGAYTDIQRAEKAIQVYLTNKRKPKAV